MKIHPVLLTQTECGGMSNTRKEKEEKVKCIKLVKSFSEHQMSHLATPYAQCNAAT